MQHTSVCT